MRLQRQTFVHTHVHSDYSLLDSIARIPDLVSKAKKLEMPGLAITDHGSLSGTWKFYNTCKENGINPILGYEAYVYSRKKFLNAEDKRKIKTHHLILLAKNYNGFQNILKLHGEAIRNAYFRRPILDDELIFENSKDMICTTACIGSRFSKLIREGKNKKARRWLERYKKVFKSDFYIELHVNDIPDQKRVNKILIELAHELKIKLIYAGDAHYIDSEDNKIQELALLIQRKKTIADLNKFKRLLESGKTREEIPSAEHVFYFDIEDVSFKSYGEVLSSAKRYGYESMWDSVINSLKNTFEINEKVNIELPKNIYHFPKYADKPNQKLERLARKYFNKTKMVHKKDYVNRFEHELEVIKSKGFSNYLLLIWDLCKFARKRKIFMSPGRGSVAGSLVAYILKITSIDPIEHRLFFERFLNPIRSEPPDIDLDFESERRDEIETYLIEKYGEERVSKIANFITFAGKSVLRDLARVLGIEQVAINQFSRDFNEKTWEIIDFGKEIERVMSLNKGAERFFTDNKLFKRACIKLHNVHRHLGVHAAGIVIAPKRIESFVPITRVGKQIVTALREGGDAREVSEAGMLKVDVLGLSNCSAIRKTLSILKETRNVNLEFKIKHLDLDDTKLLRRFAKGDTDGIFQFEGQGITGLLKSVKPQTFDDIVMINAVHRPATLQAGIARAISEGAALIAHPKITEILKDTRGNIVFQEQVISLFHKVAGFSLEEADEARQIMKKSSRLGEKPKAYKDVIEKFQKGCKKHSPDLSDDDQKNLLNYLDSFNEYSFNRSHAVSYSYLAMQTMYLKVYYFPEFMTALLNTFENKETGIGKAKKNHLEKLLHYTKARGLEILPIRIGKSKADFQVEGKTIRMGISILKGIGPTTIEQLHTIKLPDKFNVDDFFTTKLHRQLTHKRTMEALIKIGAFQDVVKYNDRTLWEAYLKWSKKKKQKFSNFIEKVPDFKFDEKLAFEYKYFGFYFRMHPLDQYKSILKDDRITTLVEAKKKGVGVVAVQILKVTPWESQRAGKMAFLDVADKTDRVDVVVWSSIYDVNYQILKPNALVLLRLKRSQRGGFELDGRSPVVRLAEIQKEGEKKK